MSPARQQSSSHQLHRAKADWQDAAQGRGTARTAAAPSRGPLATAPVVPAGLARPTVSGDQRVPLEHIVDERGLLVTRAPTVQLT